MITIRFAKQEDYELVSGVAPMIEKSQWQEWTSKKRAVVGFLDDNFAGWLLYDFYNPSTPFVKELFVLEEYRRQAVGSFLILYCEDIVRNLDYKHIMLSVAQDNTAAQAFCKRFGYTVLGSFDYFGEHTEQLLGKEIKELGCCHK